MSWYRRLVNTLRSSHNVQVELAFHIDERVDELRASGMSEEEARCLALRQFGNPRLHGERTRDRDILAPLESVLRDTQYAARVLRKSPVFLATAIISLALGIGANTAIFALADAVLLKMLPVHEPRQLVAIGVGRGFGMPYPAYEFLHGRNQVFSAMLASAGTSLTVTFPDGAEPAVGQFVSGTYFATLGVDAAVGRAILPEDDAAAVLSYNYWRRRFGGSVNAIGRTVVLNRAPFEIIGVAPQRFFGTQVGISPDVFIPFRAEPGINPGSHVLEAGTTWWVNIMGRLRDGISEQRAQANLNQLFPEFLRITIANAPPNIPKVMKDAFLQQRIVTAPGELGFSKLRATFSRPLAVLMGAVAMVLLILCANLAHLTLARTLARRHEIGLRVALGAGRSRIVRQLLTESLVVALMGGTLGLVFAVWAKRALLVLVGNDIALDLHTDNRVLLFAAAISLLSGLLFGILPALRATSIRPSRQLGAGRALATLQIALSMVLLIIAGLFVRTFQNLASLDPGFTRSQVLVFSINPGYPAARLAGYYASLLARLAAVPGVAAASFSQSSPVSGNDSATMISAFGSPAAVHVSSRSHRNVVSPGYFATVGIPLAAGRDFSEQDNENAPKTAIVNETFAREIFGSENPIGRRLGYGPGQASGAITVIGVVKDSKYNSLREVDQKMVYLPYRQFSGLGAITFELRVATDPQPVWQAARRETGKDVAITDAATLREQVGRSLSQERLVSLLTSFFGALALLLAAIGLFGATHYAAARRTREIAIRMALGAGRGATLRMILREAFLVALAGLLIGIPSAFALARLITSLLFGVTSTDPSTWIAVIGILMAAVLTASYFPARRATRVDPMAALRHD